MMSDLVKHLERKLVELKKKADQSKPPKPKRYFLKLLLGNLINILIMMVIAIGILLLISIPYQPMMIFTLQVSVTVFPIIAIILTLLISIANYRDPNQIFIIKPVCVLFKIEDYINDHNNWVKGNKNFESILHAYRVICKTHNCKPKY